ncbi:MAG: DUF1629 domain-containing protein [Pseudomonadota bacterium]
MAWLIDGAVGGKNFVDFEPEIEGAVASGAAMVRDGEPPAERSLRFAARLATSRKSVPNMWFIASRWCVDETVRQLVEAHDSGVHVFHPLSISTEAGEPLEGGPFFTAYLQGRVDCIDPDRSQVSVRTRPNGAIRLSPTTTPPKYSIRTALVGGRHI